MRIIGAIIMLLCVSTAAFADLKITRKSGASSYSGQSTVYIKGARERTEMQTITTIRQCDLKRTIQLNDRARKYVIVPDSEGMAATPAPAPTTPQGPKTTRRGAVVTHTVNITDTGERKQMFGYTARHIKTSTVMDAPAEACNPGHIEMESDGWYIDFAAAGGPACDVDRPTPPPTRGTRPDCADQVRYRTTGSGRLGFPVMVTTKMKMGGAQGGDEDDAEVAAMMSNAMTATLEVTEISTVTLDPSLFDVPAGYTQAASMQELYSPSAGVSGMAGPPVYSGGMPPGARPPVDAGQSMGAMNGSAMSATKPKQPGMIRVGVAGISNRAGGSVSLGSLRERLVGSISDSNVEAVALDASDPTAADAEAKAKDCDFVLYTDLSALKQSAASKVGGMFGRVAGVGTPGSEKYESRVDFRLVATGGSAPSLESNATAKEEGADASVGAALEREAKAVNAAAKKRQK
jgi:hypothetical protein